MSMTKFRNKASILLTFIQQRHIVIQIPSILARVDPPHLPGPRGGRLRSRLHGQHDPLQAVPEDGLRVEGQLVGGVLAGAEVEAAEDGDEGDLGLENGEPLADAVAGARTEG